MTEHRDSRGRASKDRSGRELELLAERIFRELEGRNAVVKHDDSIRGHLSGVDRQIDVSIKWQDDTGTSRLVVVEVRDWDRPADITHLDKLASVVRDTKADRGVLVCNGGFTKPTRRYARNLGIELYALHDSATSRWLEILELPVIWTTLTPIVLPTFTHQALAGDTIYGDDRNGFFANLSDDGGKTRIRLLERFAKEWNAGRLPRDGGEVGSSKPMHIYVQDSEGHPQWRPVSNFLVTYRVERRHWLGHINPAQSRGLVDILDQRIVPSYTDVPLVRDESWTEIDDPDAVAVKLRGRLYTLEDAVMDPEAHSLINAQIINARTGELEYGGE
ncbi:restriction endonuclease [Actinophytocola sp.]|uniref:restriction endonuclease n=1 Tax=Actinophytocola sp. TaxID=1872138 RepID=UPI00389A4E03